MLSHHRIALVIALAGMSVSHPAAAAPTLTPVQPPLVRQDPGASVIGTPCPLSAHIVTKAPPPAGWTELVGGFNLSLSSASVMNYSATEDYLVCKYADQYLIEKPVKKGSCTVNASSNGFLCH